MKKHLYTRRCQDVDQDMLFVDSSFFKVFKLNLISGDPEKSLIPPNSALISKSQAESSILENRTRLERLLFF